LTGARCVDRVWHIFKLEVSQWLHVVLKKCTAIGTLIGTSPDGSAVNLSGHSTEALRQQPDGSWLYVIDIPDDVG